MPPPRVVALAPAAVEIVLALGLAESLVGVCGSRASWPTALAHAEAVTIEDGGTPNLHAPRLRELAPALVFAGGPDDPFALRRPFVRLAVRGMRPRPAVYVVAPTTVGEMLSAVKTVGDALGVPARARELIVSLATRIDRVSLAGAGATDRPRIACLRQIDPPTSVGRWAPELVGLAGGIDPLSVGGLPPRACTREDVAAARPDWLVVADAASRSGASDAQIAGQLGDLSVHERVVRLSVEELLVPGPRLVDGLERLALLCFGHDFRNTM